jgi:segregation and condensation protein A
MGMSPGMTDMPLFEEDEKRPVLANLSTFVVDLDGYEGPIDVLLAMARDQKVDLTRISILQLANQYLAFVVEARRVNLELAADYLVMAAWLAFIKSRLLLPDLESKDEPSGAEMAAALAFQLRRLEAMQQAGAGIMARDRLGRDFFTRGMPERFSTITDNIFDLSLYDLLKAYGGQQSRQTEDQTLHIEPTQMHSVEEALARFRGLLSWGMDWESLWNYLPEETGNGLRQRSAIAATFAASLELAKEGRVTLRQNDLFGPIFLRSSSLAASDEEDD